MNTLSYARRYLELGYHCIPLAHKAKIPLKGFELKKYQTQAPSLAEITAWFPAGEDRNIGLVMGRGVMAVDLDGEGAEDGLKSAGVELPQFAPRSKTGRGMHVLLETPTPVGDAVALLHSEGRDPAGKWLWQIDIREKGYIVAAPSVHENGSAYRWIVKPCAVCDMPRVPSELLDLMDKFRGASRGPASASAADGAPLNGNKWLTDSLRGVSEGSRDATCAKLAGYFLAKGIPQPVVVETLNAWALRCAPPFAGVVKTVESIAAKEAAKGKGGTSGQAAQAVQAVQVQHLRDVANEIWDDLNANKADCAPTGFTQVDEKLAGGVRPGELVYLGARPGVGKTAFALQAATSWAARGRKVLIVSREMSNVALGRRMVSQIGRVNASRLRKGEGLPGVVHDQEKVLTALERMRDMSIWMTEKAVTMADVRAALDSSGADALVVDHLQLVRAANAKAERRHQVEEVSAALKGMALARAIPVLCMSTLARPVPGGGSKPSLASLRESGELEHDADIVMLIHREFKSPEATLLIAKNREGITGDVEFSFTPEYLTFAEKEGQTRSWNDRD